MPIPPMVIGAGIAAGSSLLGGALGSSAAASGASKSRQFASDLEEIRYGRAIEARGVQHAREDTAMQRLVNDSRLAGLHPAFAMGAAGSSGQALNYQGAGVPQGFSGSYAGEGIAAAGRAVGAAFTEKGRMQAAKGDRLKADALFAVNLGRARIGLQRDQVELMSATNEMKRAEAAALVNPTHMQEFLKPAEAAPKSHGIVNLPFLGKVRLDPNRMTGGGATEQVGEGADWLYGADLIRRALIQKIQKSRWNVNRNKRKMMHKWPYKEKSDFIPMYDFMGGS